MKGAFSFLIRQLGIELDYCVAALRTPNEHDLTDAVILAIVQKLLTPVRLVFGIESILILLRLSVFRIPVFGGAAP